MQSSIFFGSSYYPKWAWHGLQCRFLRQLFSLNSQTIEERIQQFYNSLIKEEKDQAQQMQIAESFSERFIELLEKDWKVGEKEKSQLIARCNRIYNTYFSHFSRLSFEIIVNIAKFSYGNPTFASICQDFYQAEAVIHQQIFRDIYRRLTNFSPSNSLVEMARRHYGHLDSSNLLLCRKLNRFIFRQLLTRVFCQPQYVQMLNELAKRHEELKVLIHSPPLSSMQSIDLDPATVQSLTAWIELNENEALLELWEEFSKISKVRKQSQMIAQNTEIKTTQQKAILINTWLKSHPKVLEEYGTISLAGVNYTLAPEIGYFSRLTELTVRDTRLSCNIPEEIGNLTHLKILNLSGNKLQRLPHTIGKLTQLKKLNLEHNELQVLPNSMTQLSNLTHLYLAFNQLTHLPDMSWFVKIHTIDVRNNPLNEVRLTESQLLIARKLRLSSQQAFKIPKTNFSSKKHHL